MDNNQLACSVFPINHRYPFEGPRKRKKAVQILAEGVEEILGPWFGHSWESPDKEFVNKRQKGGNMSNEEPSSLLTPAASPESKPVEGGEGVAGR